LSGLEASLPFILGAVTTAGSLFAATQSTSLPDTDDTEDMEAAEKEAEDEARRKIREQSLRRGFASTILSGQGAFTTPTTRKTLLGQ
jgi:hypothetical protein